VTERRHTIMGPPSRDFRLLWWATAVSVLGTWAAGIALAVRTYSETHQSAWVSAVFAAEFLPPVVIGLGFANALTRLAPKRGMVGSDVVNGAVYTALVFVHTPIAVVALATVAGAATGVFRPLVLGAVPAVVADADIETANGSLAAIDTAMSSLGQVGAGAVIAIAGASAVLGINAVSFFASAILIGACRSLAESAVEEALRVGAVHQLRASVRAIRRAPAVLQVSLCGALLWVILGVVNSIEVPLLLGPFHSGPALAALAIGAAMAGTVLGSLMAGRAGRRLATLYPLFLAVLGAAVLASGLSRSLGMVVLFFIVAGIANGLVVVHNRSVLQRGTEPAQRPAILALLQGSWAVATIAGAGAGGAVAGLVSPRAAFVLAGGVGLTAAATAVATQPKAVAATV
jgi:MFS family permease